MNRSFFFYALKVQKQFLLARQNHVGFPDCSRCQKKPFSHRTGVVLKIKTDLCVLMFDVLLSNSLCIPSKPLHTFDKKIIRLEYLLFLYLLDKIDYLKKQ